MHAQTAVDAAIEDIATIQDAAVLATVHQSQRNADAKE